MPRRRAKSCPGPFLLHAELLRDRITDIDKYPYCLPSIRGITTLPFHSKVTFFVGENGSGKSTLLEAIAVESGLNPEGGSRNFNFATRASHSPLHNVLRLGRAPGSPGDRYFLRAESFYNVASEIERLDMEPGGPPIIDAYGGVSLHEQSHGVPRRVVFRVVQESVPGQRVLSAGRARGRFVAQTAVPFPCIVARLRETRRAVRDRDALADHHGLSRSVDLCVQQRGHPARALPRDRALPSHTGVFELPQKVVGCFAGRG